MRFVAILLLVSPLLAGVTLPEGAELELRLKTKVSSNTSKPKDPVEAVLISPVVRNGHIAVPAGITIKGIVEGATAAKPDERAVLNLAFSGLRLEQVDNARESVDDKGQILGILASETLSAQMQRGIEKLSERSSGLGSLLATVRTAMFKDPTPDIVYEPGVEFHAKVLKPVEVNSAPQTAQMPGPVEPAENLYRLVNGQPFQTKAENPPLPSDITNLMFIGTEEELTGAFKAAGWATAASLSAEAKLEVVRAVAEGRGYKEAPMSILLLADSRPDLVFEKQNNTFAKRHHLRIWRRPEMFQGKQVWVCAATHDTGIEFSAEHRTFIHKIDSRIDAERAKVVNDLVFTGNVKGLSLVDRPEVPPQSQNATGDKIETDRRMAVLLLAARGPHPIAGPSLPYR